jgi:hypothetical protein
MKAMDAIIHEKLKQRLSLGEKIVLVSRILTNDMSQSELKYWASYLTYRKPPNFNAMSERYGSIIFISTSGFLREARSWGNKKALVVVVHNKNSNHWSVLWRQGIGFNAERFNEKMLLLEANSRNITKEELIREGLNGGGPPNMWTSSTGVGRETKIQNMKETLLQLAYSCLRESRIST